MTRLEAIKELAKIWHRSETDGLTDCLTALGVTPDELERAGLTPW